MTNPTTSPEAVELIADLRRIGSEDGAYVEMLAAADCIQALSAENGRLKAEQPYTYMGKDGKSVLARELEDERDVLAARIAGLEAQTDASVWADEFCKNWPTALSQVPGREGVETDEDFKDIMLGWFANAIMAGVYSVAEQPEPVVQVKPLEWMEHDRFLEGWGVPDDCIARFQGGNITVYSSDPRAIAMSEWPFTITTRSEANVSKLLGDSRDALEHALDLLPDDANQRLGMEGALKRLNDALRERGNV